MRTWATAIAIIGTSLLLGACGGEDGPTDEDVATQTVLDAIIHQAEVQTHDCYDEGSPGAPSYMAGPTYMMPPDCTVSISPADIDVDSLFESQQHPEIDTSTLEIGGDPVDFRLTSPSGTVCATGSVACVE